MSRVLVVLVLLAGVAHAQKKLSPKQAKAANKTAFEKALAKLEVKQIKLATMPADHEEATDDTHFVGNVVSNNAPTFVVDKQKGVFRVVRKMNTVGRVTERVCHAGPVPLVRVKRTRFDVPKGHTFKGDVEVSYDAYVIDEQNTCR
jgi:hypothetical protein